MKSSSASTYLLPALLVAAIVAPALAQAPQSPAATITVLSAGAVRAGLIEIVERFQKETGHVVKVQVYDQLTGKIVRYEDGNAVMAHVAKSRGRDFGFGMVTGIAQQRANGLALAGALPPEIQQATTYGAAVSSAGNKEVAGQFLRYLDSANSRKLLRDAGIQ